MTMVGFVCCFGSTVLKIEPKTFALKYISSPFEKLFISGPAEPLNCPGWAEVEGPPASGSQRAEITDKMWTHVFGFRCKHDPKIL